MKEVALRKSAFESILDDCDQQIETIYFGGGTPSLACEADIARMARGIRNTFSADRCNIQEITMEANPGDLTLEKLVQIRKAGVNRLSIGIQSFQSPLLQAIGRRHDAQTAIEAVKLAQQAGFDNISIDLMYGLPGETMEQWQKDVEIACSLHVQHISAYCLTYEEGTPLYALLEKGEVRELDDELLNKMQEYAANRLKDEGIIRYEISNYAIPGKESKHNGSYWTGAPYMGLGAGAHSYDGHRNRQWNPDDLMAYLHAVEAAKGPEDLPLQGEVLTDDDIYNETVMLGLRTLKGVDIEHIDIKYLNHFLNKSADYINRGLLQKTDNYYCATTSGMRILNRIIEDLMI